MKEINKERKDYLTWDQYFMAIAKLSAMRSKDPNTQVGACIVDKTNRILSIGYNGAPNGFHDNIFPWDREGETLKTKYAGDTIDGSFLSYNAIGIFSSLPTCIGLQAK